MKARLYQVISTALLFLLVGAATVPAQHEQHGGQAPAPKATKKVTKKKSPARSTRQRSKRASSTKQATGSSPQKSSQMQSPHAGHQSGTQQSEMQHSGGMHQQSEMQPRGSTDGVMPKEAHDVLAAGYAQNIIAFARTLRDQVQAIQAVDPIIARDTVGEIRRSFTSLREHHDSNSATSASGHSHTGSTAQEMSGPLSGLERSLSALELEVVSATPVPSVILQRADEVIRAAEAIAASSGGHGNH